MPELDEPEILYGMRGWCDAQARFVGAPDSGAPRYVVDVGWYDTSVDEHEGAFCMVNNGGPMEDLIGYVVHVECGPVAWMVYCVGAAGLPVDMALARAAFFRFAPLSEPTIRAVVRRVVPGVSS